jgi:hypothetical protein
VLRAAGEASDFARATSYWAAVRLTMQCRLLTDGTLIATRRRYRPPRIASRHLDVVVLQRERADALAGRREDCVEHCGCGDADRRVELLAPSAAGGAPAHLRSLNSLAFSCTSSSVLLKKPAISPSDIPRASASFKKKRSASVHGIPVGLPRRLVQRFNGSLSISQRSTRCSMSAVRQSSRLGSEAWAYRALPLSASLGDRAEPPRCCRVKPVYLLRSVRIPLRLG